MQITSITYSLESTINIGDFENVKPSYSVTVELDDASDSPEDARLFAKRLVTKWLNAEYDEVQEELKQISQKRVPSK